jgi:hypothetical protein
MFVLTLVPTAVIFLAIERRFCLAPGRPNRGVETSSCDSASNRST